MPIPPWPQPPFRKAKWIMVTFGTSWVYRHIERDIIVSNCHKHPAWEFRRELLTVEDITDRWDDIVKAFPDKHFIFTVSPIRHRKDGMHGNQISKAILLLAVEHMVSAFPNTHYFPAYEIVLDELRDYSWFTDDLTHPLSSGKDSAHQFFEWRVIKKVPVKPYSLIGTFLSFNGLRQVICVHRAYCPASEDRPRRLSGPSRRLRA